jgi:protein-tyrosine phosphatase
MPVPKLLIVCTANQCRSPIAGAFLARHARLECPDLEITTAGFLQSGSPAPEEVLNAAARFGLDLGSHRSLEVSEDLLLQSDLIIGLTRRHVREIAVAAPSTWPRTFTLRQLVRLGEAVGPRAPTQPISEWLALLHANRTSADLLGADPIDDVVDPTGGPSEGYDLLAEDLSHLTRAVVDLLWPVQR